MNYEATRSRVEDYFDRTATETWARLTSDAPVSRIRATVRAGRDAMRALLLGRLPQDLTGQRVLDAGCGTGLLTADLAARGADVLAVDISPALIDIARTRLPLNLPGRVTFQACDLGDPGLGRFDHIVAMDSLIYYRTPDLVRVLSDLQSRAAGTVAFTIAPRTPPLMAMWYAGKLFPRADRSPVMEPQSARKLRTRLPVSKVGRVARGFYISDALELRR